MCRSDGYNEKGCAAESEAGALIGMVRPRSHASAAAAPQRCREREKTRLAKLVKKAQTSSPSATQNPRRRWPRDLVVLPPVTREHGHADDSVSRKKRLRS